MNRRSRSIEFAIAGLILLVTVPTVSARESAAAPASDELSEGVALFEAGDHERAAELFRKRVAAAPNDARAAHFLGRVRFQQNQPDEAVEWLAKATKLAPGNSDYHLWLGRGYLQQLDSASMFSKLGLSKKVRAHYGKAIELDAGNLDARESLAGYYFEAPGMAGGSVAKGMAQVEEIRKRDPLRAHLALAAHYQQKKKYGDAEQEYDAALSLDPKHLDARLGLAILYQAMERWADALSTLDELLGIEPGHPGALYQVGRTAALSGKGLDRGVECLTAYLEGQPGPEQPSLAWAHYRLGLVFERKGDRVRARREYEAALAKDPAHEEAGTALKKLR